MLKKKVKKSAYSLFYQSVRIKTANNVLKLSQKYTTRKQSVMVVVKANRWPDYGKYFSPETLYNPYKQFDTQTLPKKLEKKNTTTTKKYPKVM